MLGARQAGSIWENYAFGLWSAKQIRTKTAFRLWYVKHVLRGEAELRLVAGLCDPDRLTLDVGANRGMYSVAAMRFSKSVIAFEPQPHFARFLKTFLPKEVRILECAVSHSAGISTLLVPSDPRYHAEARLSNDDVPAAGANGRLIKTSVRTVSLDDVVDGPVGLIKVDVEGHELAVLQGARRTIESCRPNIIIEIEDRHQPGALGRAWEWFDARNYRGFWLKRDQLVPVGPPIVETASTGGEYVYNFVFLPAEREKIPQPSIWPALSCVLTV